MELRQQTIWVTGASGFLGRHLVARLRQSGVTRLLTPTHAEVDLLDPTPMRAYLERHRPDVVFHLAARVGGIGANRLKPATFAYQNLLMGTQLIEACRLAGVRKFVLAGTICAYPKWTQVPFREEDLWNGYPEETNAPYGLAKKMLLVLLQAYRQEHGFPGINPLLTNLYGPGDNFDPETSHVIPALLRRFDEARRQGRAQVTVWGSGQPTREFLFVEDAARALVLAAEKIEDSQPINIGTGQEIAIAELATRIAEVVGYRGEIVFDASRPDGQPRRCLDVSRAAVHVGFQADTALSDGLARTWEWYRSQK